MYVVLKVDTSSINTEPNITEKSQLKRSLTSSNFNANFRKIHVINTLLFIYSKINTKFEAFYFS